MALEVEQKASELMIAVCLVLTCMAMTIMYGHYNMAMT